MIRGAWALLVFAVATLTISGSALLVSLLRREKVDLKPAILWSRCMLATLGTRVEYLGTEHARGHLPCVFVSNHQSNVDIWAVTPALPLETKYVIKESLFGWPILGRTLRRAEYISIDRRDHRKAIESLRLAGRRIRQGASVIVFAEGTRSRDGRLGPFKKGAFHLALQARVPIVPVAISGSFEILRPGEWHVHPGTVKVRFLPPIDVEPFQPDNAAGLAFKVRTRIAEALCEKSEEHSMIDGAVGQT